MNKTNKLLIIISGIIIVIILALIIVSLNRKPNKYNITFDSAGGSPVLDQAVEKNSKILIPAEPTKEGYIFLEWQYNNKPFDFNSKITKDITLTAVWQEIKSDVEMVNVKFDTDGGSPVSRQIIEKGSAVKEPDTPTKEGYIFVEWQLEKEKFDFTTTVENDIVLHAIWKTKEAERSSNPSSSKQSPEPSSSENEKKYTIIFDSAGGSDVPRQTVKENEKVQKPTNPTKTGYKFQSWLLDDANYDFETEVTSNLTLTASWIENQYEISYNKNADDALGEMGNTSCMYNQYCQLKTNQFTRENYTFIGWSTSSSGQTEYTDSSTVKNLISTEGTVTLYAVWQENE